MGGPLGSGFMVVSTRRYLSDRACHGPRLRFRTSEFPATNVRPLIPAPGEAVRFFPHAPASVERGRIGKQCRAPGSVDGAWRCVPDSGSILRDGAITGELSGAGDVENGLTRPGLRIGVQFAEFLLGLG